MQIEMGKGWMPHVDHHNKLSKFFQYFLLSSTLSRIEVCAVKVGQRAFRDKYFILALCKFQPFGEIRQTKYEEPTVNAC